MKFLRNVDIYELSRQQPLWDPIPYDENDIKLGAVTDDEGEGGIAPINVIHLKGVARKLEAAQNGVYRCILNP